MKKASAKTTSLWLALLTGLCLPGVTLAQGFDPDVQGRGAAMLTRPMTCYFDSSTLFGAYAVENEGFREFRFQLREDGMLLVNGHEVKPVQVELNGTSSWAASDVGSIVVEPKEAAMLQLLPPDQKRAFQELAARRGLAMTGGVARFVQIFFSDHSVIFRSIEDTKELDKVSHRCR